MGFQKSRPYACEDRLLHAVFLKDYDVCLWFDMYICIFVCVCVYSRERQLDTVCLKDYDVCEYVLVGYVCACMCMCVSGHAYIIHASRTHMCICCPCLIHTQPTTHTRNTHRCVCVCIYIISHAFFWKHRTWRWLLSDVCVWLEISTVGCVCATASVYI